LTALLGGRRVMVPEGGNGNVCRGGKSALGPRRGGKGGRGKTGQTRYLEKRGGIPDNYLPAKNVEKKKKESVGGEVPREKGRRKRRPPLLERGKKGRSPGALESPVKKSRRNTVGREKRGRKRGGREYEKLSPMKGESIGRCAFGGKRKKKKGNWFGGEKGGGGGAFSFS